MSKIKAPFFSLGAKGSIGDSLTYSSWKGINTVRTKPEPANPNTSAQQTVRNDFQQCVNMWHNPMITSEDVKAYNFAASLAPKPMSGFNWFVMMHRNADPGDGYSGIFELDIADAVDDVDVKVKVQEAGDYKLIIRNGPDAGYSETITATAGETITYNDVPGNKDNIGRIHINTGGHYGTTGKFRCVPLFA